MSNVKTILLTLLLIIFVNSEKIIVTGPGIQSVPLNGQERILILSSNNLFVNETKLYINEYFIEYQILNYSLDYLPDGYNELIQYIQDYTPIIINYDLSSLNLLNLGSSSIQLIINNSIIYSGNLLLTQPIKRAGEVYSLTINISSWGITFILLCIGELLTTVLLEQAAVDSYPRLKKIHLPSFKEALKNLIDYYIFKKDKSQNNISLSTIRCLETWNCLTIFTCYGIVVMWCSMLSFHTQYSNLSQRLTNGVAWLTFIITFFGTWLSFVFSQKYIDQRVYNKIINTERATTNSTSSDGPSGKTKNFKKYLKLFWTEFKSALKCYTSKWMLMSDLILIITCSLIFYLYTYFRECINIVQSGEMSLLYYAIIDLLFIPMANHLIFSFDKLRNLFAILSASLLLISHFLVMMSQEQIYVEYREFTWMPEIDQNEYYSALGYKVTTELIYSLAYGIAVAGFILILYIQFFRMTLSRNDIKRTKSRLNKENNKLNNKILKLEQTIKEQFCMYDRMEIINLINILRFNAGLTNLNSSLFLEEYSSDGINSFRITSVSSKQNNNNNNKSLSEPIIDISSHSVLNYILKDAGLRSYLLEWSVQRFSQELIYFCFLIKLYKTTSNKYGKLHILDLCNHYYVADLNISPYHKNNFILAVQGILKNFTESKRDESKRDESSTTTSVVKEEHKVLKDNNNKNSIIVSDIESPTLTPSSPSPMLNVSSMRHLAINNISYRSHSPSDGSPKMGFSSHHRVFTSGKINSGNSPKLIDFGNFSIMQLYKNVYPPDDIFNHLELEVKKLIVDNILNKIPNYILDIYYVLSSELRPWINEKRKNLV